MSHPFSASLQRPHIFETLPLTVCIILLISDVNRFRADMKFAIYFPTAQMCSSAARATSYPVYPHLRAWRWPLTSSVDTVTWQLLQTGSGLMVGFTELLQTVSIAISLIHAVFSSLQHALSLLTHLRLHQSLPGDGSQQCPLLRCWRLSHNSMFQLSCLWHLSTDRTENTVPLLLFPIVAVQTTQKRLLYFCLSRGRCPAMGLHVTILRMSEAITPIHGTSSWRDV
jgi:hypothetical protein